MSYEFSKVELVCEIKSDPQVKVRWMVGKEHNMKEFDESNKDFEGNFDILCILKDFENKN